MTLIEKLSNLGGIVDRDEMAKAMMCVILLFSVHLSLSEVVQSRGFAFERFLRLS